MNIERANELIARGRMRPAGRKAFETRRDDRSAIYSYEQRGEAKLGAEFERQFRSNKKAWDFFQARPPGYRKAATYWSSARSGRRPGEGGWPHSSTTRRTDEPSAR